MNQPCPKWANALRQLLCNQIDRGTAIYFYVSHTPIPVATEGVWWAKAPKKWTKPPKIEICTL